ncbi:MAG: aminopeptidase P family protein [Alicyclobacillaceae bacterium]|nr:aminopeptidase P family protein [Alicyclobacillaceae bacterium]
MYKQRVERLCEWMAGQSLKHLVLLHDGVHSFAWSNPVSLVSGYKGVGESMLIVDVSGRTTLVHTPAWDGWRAERVGAAETIGAEQVSDVLTGWLARTQPAADAVAFVGLDAFNHACVTAVSERLGGEARRVDDEFYALLRAKSPDELQRAAEATWIAERAYERMLELVKPGMAEFEVAAEVAHVCKSLGADDNFLLISASQHNRSVRAAGRRKLDVGDILLAEISPSVGGQFTQICRSVCIGSCSPTLTEQYALLTESLRRGIAAARPGVAISEVVRTMNEPLVAKGYGKYCYPPYMRVRGHGMGVNSVFPGDIMESNDRLLEAGMFFVLHPNQYLPDVGYLLCGEPVVITEEGAKALTRREPGIDAVYCSATSC